MVIGRAKTPVCFREVKVNLHNLPVVYRNNKKAWMKSEIGMSIYINSIPKCEYQVVILF